MLRWFRFGGNSLRWELPFLLGRKGMNNSKESFNAIKNKIIIITLLICTLFLSRAFAIDGPFKESRKMYEEGLFLAQNGNCKDAILKFKEAIALDNNFPEAHHDLGNCYRITGQYKDAIKETEKSILLAPQDWTSYRLDLGHLYIEQGQWKSAINQLNILRQLDFNMAKQLEGDILFARGQKLKFGEVAADGTAYMLRKPILDKNKKQAWDLFQQTATYINNINTDSSEKAVDSLKKAIELDPENNMYYLFLARIYANQRRYGDAINILEPYLSQYPKDINILYMLAALYMQVKKYNNALAYFEKIKEIDEIIYLISKKWVNEIKEALDEQGMVKNE
jgi:tetratricopeptide (TPR) repeat protein